jgi:uncharacterized protein (TIGR02117 family)
MIRWARRFALAIASLAFILAVLSFALRRPANPALYPPQGEFIIIHVVDHGYHAGLILPRRIMAELATTERLASLSAALNLFEPFEQVEVGWGEENFYRSVPAASLSTIPHVFRALFNPANASVLHVVGIGGDLRSAFPASDMIELSLSPEGLKRIAQAIDSQFRADPAGSIVPLGPGLYGPSAFFAAQDRYHLLNTCNHWVGQLLALAGLPYAPVESFISAGLMADIRRRALPSPRAPVGKSVTLRRAQT